MSQIVIGKSNGKNVGIDLKLLMSTRLLITSDSGGGKSWLLKRVIEQAFGKVGILVIDPEGEFAPLREQFDFYLVGKGGETPADVRSAEKVARTLLGARASAICDLYDMKPSERHEWVRLFLEGLLEAPKEMRHPYLVIVDEAHLFAPEKGMGESVATDNTNGLATRGRKRMLCPIYATQRLATLSKTVTGMCLNRLVGPTFESINQKRAAQELGISEPAKVREFYADVKMLEPGNFYALGRAITKELELVHIGDLQTAHGEEAVKYELTPPPPTEKVRALLAKLGDLPKQAEEEARTAAEFKKKIRTLEAQLRAQPIQTKVSEKLVADPKAIERAVRQALDESKKQIAKRDAMILRAKQTCGRIWKLAEEFNMTDAPQDVALSASDFIKEISGGEIQPQKGVLTHPRASEHRVTETHPRISSHPRPDISFTNGNGDLGGPHKKILKALAEVYSIGKTRAPRAMVAGWAGYSPQGGAFGNPLGALSSAGYVSYPAPGLIQLTDKGLEVVGSVDPPSEEEIHQRVLNVCSGPERKILAVLIDSHEMLTRAELAERAGYEEKGGAFGNPLGALHTKGFCEYPERGKVVAADWLWN